MDVHPAGCWEWTASIFKAGYGKLREGGRTAYAHRLSYVIAHGSIPDGMMICHRCDNRRCVNPAHLFAGTQRDNVQDMLTKGRGNHRSPTGMDNSQATRSFEDVERARALMAAGETTRSVARRFGVSQHTAMEWKHRRTRAVA